MQTKYSNELKELRELTEEQRNSLATILNNSEFIVGHGILGNIYVKDPKPDHPVSLVSEDLCVPIGFLIEESSSEGRYKAGYCNCGEPFAMEYHQRLNEIFRSFEGTLLPQ